MYITKEYLISHPSHLFVFGDNIIRQGLGGGAKLRHMKNSYGFITKKYPDNNDKSFYKPDEYILVYKKELKMLKDFIKNNNQYDTILISQLGGGLASKYNIFKEIIESNIKNDLSEFSHIKYLW